jgi:hypothetical protein
MTRGHLDCENANVRRVVIDQRRHYPEVTGGRPEATINDDLRPVTNPELPAIARVLPANAACQIVRVANQTEATVPK